MMAAPFYPTPPRTEELPVTRALTIPSRRRKADPRSTRGSDLKHLETQDSGYYSSSRPQFPETERETPSSRRRNLRKKDTSVKYQIMDPDSDDERVAGVRRSLPGDAHRQNRSPGRPPERPSLPMHFGAPEHLLPRDYEREREPKRMPQSTTTQKRLRGMRQSNLPVDSLTSNPRQRSPFRSPSSFEVPAPVRRSQPSPPLQKQRKTVSPREVMLDEYDIDESNHNIPLFPEQTQYTPGRSKSSLANFHIPFSPGSTSEIPQQYPFVIQHSQQSRHETLIGTTKEPTNRLEPSPHGPVTYDYGSGIFPANSDEHKSVANPLAALRKRAGLSTVEGDYIDNPDFRFLPPRLPFASHPGMPGRRSETEYSTSPEEAVERYQQHIPKTSNDLPPLSVASKATGDHAPRTSAQNPYFVMPNKRPGIQIKNGLGELVTLGKSSTDSAASPPNSTLPPKPSSRRRHKAQTSRKDPAIEILSPHSQYRQQSQAPLFNWEVRKDTVPPTEDYSFLNHFSEYGTAPHNGEPSSPDFLQQFNKREAFSHSKDSPFAKFGDLSGFSRSSLSDPRNERLENKGIWAPYTISEDRTGNSEAVSHLLLAGLCRKEYSLADFNEPQNSDDEEPQSPNEEFGREEPERLVRRRAAPFRRSSTYSSDEDPPIYSSDESSAEEYLQRPIERPRRQYRQRSPRIVQLLPSFDLNSGADWDPSIYVRNLPLSTRSMDLVELFSIIGKVERAEIQYEPNGRSRGTGIVEFGNADDAETAITKFTGYVYGGRPLSLSFVKAN